MTTERDVRGMNPQQWAPLTAQQQYEQQQAYQRWQAANRPPVRGSTTVVMTALITLIVLACGVFLLAMLSAL